MTEDHKERKPDAYATGAAQDGLLREEQDPMLQAVLKDFRASVHHWSAAAYHDRSQALVLSPLPRRIIGQRSAAWALSLVLAAGVVSTGAYEFHQRDLARQAAVQREIEHQRQLARQHARETDELLAKVDSDVSRQVPSAMEPLASLMADDNTE
jgi:hypothetical protein